MLSFGQQSERLGSLSVTGVEAPIELPAADPRHRKFYQTMLQNLVMSGTLPEVDVVHCHTWYAHYAGCLVRTLQGVPLVLTTHSLEPHRPWKVEQLGTAYYASSWVERTAYQNADGVVAVSQSMKQDVQSLYGVPPDHIRVIHNGIDLAEYRPTPDPSVLAQHGIAAGRSLRPLRRAHHAAEGHHSSRHAPSGICGLACRSSLRRCTRHA